MLRIALAVGIGVALATVSALRAHERITTTVTWDREISAIVRARCVTCHRDGGSAMSLATYALARPWARAIKHEVLTRRMPTWHAVRGYGDFANDPSLSPFEIALVAAWVDGGAPRSFVPKGSPAPGLPGPPEAPIAPGDTAEPVHSNVREVVMACGDRQAPAGRLLGLRPQLKQHASLRAIARLPAGRQEILGWFADFDPELTQTYWLRTPLELPAGTRLHMVNLDGSIGIETAIGSEPCRVVLLVDGRQASAR
jgi:mono/diheme cytochrome c family protein